MVVYDSLFCDSMPNFSTIVLYKGLEMTQWSRIIKVGKHRSWRSTPACSFAASQTLVPADVPLVRST